MRTPMRVPPRASSSDRRIVCFLELWLGSECFWNLTCVICGQVRGGAGGLRPDRVRDRHVSMFETLASSFAFIKKTDQSVVARVAGRCTSRRCNARGWTTRTSRRRTARTSCATPRPGCSGSSRPLRACDGASTCMWRRIHLGAVSAPAGNGPVFCLLRGLAWRSHSLGAAAGPSSS